MTHAPLILVVGMHRSGTSLLGSILQAIGVATPGDLIPGDENNPEGYFERRDVTDLQEQLLIRLGRWWPSAEGVLDLPPAWLSHASTRRALDQLRTILAAESLRQERPWAIKDPRTSLLLPLWRRVCGDLRIPLRLLLAVRDPGEVAASLCRRDGEAAGMAVARAEQLWWRHHEAVLAHSLELPLGMIDYGRWFETPQAARQQLLHLMAFCELPARTSGGDEASDPRLLAALQQIRPEHRRSRAIALAGHTPAPIVYRQWRRGGGFTPTPVTAASLSSWPSGRRRLRRLWWRSRNRRRCAADRWAQLQAWFAPRFYTSRHLDPTQVQDPLITYLTWGWRQGHQPHPLFDPGFYLAQCHRRGLVPEGDRSLLEHFLRRGIPLQIPCTPLLDPDWFERRGGRFQAAGPPGLADLHPWGDAALALADHDLAAAASLLAAWQTHGLPDADLRTIHTVEGPWLRWACDREGPDPPAAPVERLESLVLPASHWQLHGWWASLVDPSQPTAVAAEAGEAAALLIPLRPGLWPRPDEVQRILTARRLLLDPDSSRRRTWRRLGCAVASLAPPTSAQLDAWLPADPWLEQAAARFALPRPAALIGMQRLWLGRSGEASGRPPEPGTLPIPLFDRLILDSDEARRALAAWLWHCRRRGLELVVLRDDRTPSRLWTWLPVTWRERPAP